MSMHFITIIVLIVLNASAWASEISEIVAGNAEKEAKPLVTPLVTADTILAVTKVVTPNVDTCGYANLGTVFERVIGLGHWCLTKGQINKYFAPELHLMKTKKGHADLFDWMYMHDYSKLAIALEHRLEDFFERKDLYTQAEKGKDVYNRTYNMTWNHLFDHNLGTCDNSEGKIGTLTEEKLDLLLPAIKIKINYLKDKFIAAKRYKTLYIISHPRTGPDLATLIKVRDSLTIIRDGDKNFCLLFLTPVKTYEGKENIIVHEAKNLSREWHGADTQRWKQILDEFKFTSDIWQ